MIKYGLAVIFLGGIFFLTQVFNYWKQSKLDIWDQSIFKFSNQKTKMSYSPYQAKKGGSLQTNGLGVIGKEIPAGDQVILLLGTCTAIDICFPLQNKFQGEKISVVTASKFHLTIRESLIQLESSLQQIQPQLIILNLGTIMYRDIEFYNKDIYQIPESVLIERSFGYWTGGIDDWFSFMWMKRKNEFYFAMDRQRVETMRHVRGRIVKGEYLESDLFDPIPMAQSTLPNFEKDVLSFIDQCSSNDIPLIIHNPPVDETRMTKRQKEVYDLFNESIQRLCKDHQVEFVDLFSMMSKEPNWYLVGEPYHLSEKGSKQAAEIIYPRAQGYLGERKAFKK